MNRYTSFSQTIKFISAWGLMMTTLLALPFASSSKPAFCACCADPGAWDLSTRKIENEARKELNRLLLDGVADFYMTAAWPDGVSGVAVPDAIEPGYFVASLVREQQDWKFFFKTSKGEKGTLILTLPATATFFAADIEPRAKSEHHGSTTLYKEIRLEGTVRGTGIFAKGITPKTRFRLALQGKGNWCLSAEDFHRWNLRIIGPQAKYTLYGFFTKPSA